jgi:hypothetical protein
MIAGDGVEHAAAQEGGADQQVEYVKHRNTPDSAATRSSELMRRTAVAAVQRADIADPHIESMPNRWARHINSI